MSYKAMSEQAMSYQAMSDKAISEQAMSGKATSDKARRPTGDWGGVFVPRKKRRGTKNLGFLISDF